MDHMIKEKFIVTDGEKVTDEIYRVTGLDIEIDQIIENISSEESNIYFKRKIYRKNRKMKKTLFWHGLIQESR